MLLAYMDDVRIVGPAHVAIPAYLRLKDLALRRLGVVEVPSKGGVMWFGEGSPDLFGLPQDMPGVQHRLTHDKLLGVFVGDSRPVSITAIKVALATKFSSRAAILDSLPSISDPDVKIQLLRCCISTRPGFWLRTMDPELTHDAAAAFDTRVRTSLSDICNTAALPPVSWDFATLPNSLGGLGIISQSGTSHAAHLASWSSAWANICLMFPLAIRISAADLDTCALPFACGIRGAHQHVEAAAAAVRANPDNVPLPPNAIHDPVVPGTADLATRLSHAQRRFAFVVHSAKWMRSFTMASIPHRARILSNSGWGAMAAFGAVPSDNFRVVPVSYVAALQLRLRLPLTLLVGLTKCVCGSQLDEFGDHIFSCSHFVHERTPGHDLIEAVVARMGKQAGKDVKVDSKRLRVRSIAYSPHHQPDITFLHGQPDASHTIIDIVTPSVVTVGRVARAAASRLVAAEGAEADKRGVFGNILGNTLVPFAIEDGGSLGKEALGLFKLLQSFCENQVRFLDESLQTWSAKGFANFYLQLLSVALLRGQGHLFMQAAAAIRAAP